MSPWTSIWIKTEKTIDQFKDSNWVQRGGLLVYFILGINTASETKIPLLIDGASKGIYLLVIIITGLIFGLAFRMIWVNVIFYFGKIWKGQATKKNINTVLALSSIPEIFRLISLFISIFTQKDLINVQINYSLTIICLFLSLRILLIGLSRVQKFSYGISLLTIVAAPLTLWVLIHLIREL